MPSFYGKPGDARRRRSTPSSRASSTTSGSSTTSCSRWGSSDERARRPSASTRRGSGAILEARRAGDLDAVRSMAPVARRRRDLLAVGALADRVRAEEVGRRRAHLHERAPGAERRRAIVVHRATGRRRRGARAPARGRHRAHHRAARGARAGRLVGLRARARAGGARLRRERARRVRSRTSAASPIADDATKKVKGAGMVSVQAMKQQRARGLVRRSGRQRRHRRADGASSRSAAAAAGAIDGERHEARSTRIAAQGPRRRAPRRSTTASPSSSTRPRSPSAQLANEVRERLHGDRTYFNRNMRIEVTNVCVASCLFCSFAKLEEGAPGAHTMTLEEAWRELEARMDDPPSEIHIVNGLHPGLAVLVLRGAPRAASSASSPTCT